jgi:pantothenate kinase type III
VIYKTNFCVQQTIGDLKSNLFSIKCFVPKKKKCILEEYLKKWIEKKKKKKNYDYHLVIIILIAIVFNLK